MVKIIINSVKKSIIIDIKNPSAITTTGILYIMLNNNQGSAKPTVISKTLLPIDEETA